MKLINQIKLLFIDQKGFSLIELLAALAISSIVITSIYGVYFTGIKAYKVIGVEGQIRDEADYVIARIMNSIYELSPDTIRPCTTEAGVEIDNCYRFINDQKLTVSSSDNQLVEEVQKSNDEVTVNELKLESEQILLNNEPLNVTNISITDGDSSSIDDSYIQFSCTNYEIDLSSNEKRCINGIFDIQLTLENKDYGPNNDLYVKPLTLTSKFGY
ncbi:PilW family protein [Bacillus pinisoli]|uniref:PilW family protein n=1 Tax=Bacillus pinisoli TaxID=2901866 RepID=UPI001FF60FB8|nr:prepilin-type N-terminal cleavage/methylation domain-containing protein [Bacillus pinisoli]